MDHQVSAVVVRKEDRTRETFEDPSRGDVSWFTFFSSDRTATDAMSAGLAQLEPNGGRLNPHRHEQPELYFIAEGSGVLTIEGIERDVAAGSAVFIPGNAEHGIRNDGDSVLRIFYVFPTGCFADVIYRFTER